MKQKLSISIDGDLIEKIEEKVRSRLFRNKSHFIEFAIAKEVEDA
ncbi:MAG: ribbon-helix-helix protein, CopG family [Candidatus Nanoarchaeia archaeon]